MESLYKEVQGIYHNGVGGNHVNGVTENTIKTMVNISRVMMIYISLRCPTSVKKRLVVNGYSTFHDIVQ